MTALPLQIINIPVLGVDEITPYTLSLSERTDGNYLAVLLNDTGDSVASFFFLKGHVAISAVIQSEGL